MRPIQFCVGINCSSKLEANLPLCHRGCWWNLSTDQKRQIGELADAGHELPARVLAALVSELPVRDMNTQFLERNRTWQTVQANVADVLARQEIDYLEAVRPWHEFLEAVFWAIGGPDSIGKWSHVEIACAMVRSRSGVDGYVPHLIAAAVDLDARLAAERLGIAPAGGAHV